MTSCIAKMHRTFSAEQNAGAMLWLFLLVAIGTVIVFIVPGNGAADRAQGFALMTIVAGTGLVSAFYDATFKQTDFGLLNGAPWTGIMAWSLIFGFYWFKFHEAVHAIGVY